MRGHQCGGRRQRLPRVMQVHEQGDGRALRRPGRRPPLLIPRSGPGRCGASAMRPRRRRSQQGTDARGPGGTPGTVPASRWPVPAGRPARRGCEATRAGSLHHARTPAPGWSRCPGRPASRLAPRRRSPPSPARRQTVGRHDLRGRSRCGARPAQAGPGRPVVPESVDQVLHRRAWHGGISFGLGTQQAGGRRARPGVVRKG